MVKPFSTEILKLIIQWDKCSDSYWLGKERTKGQASNPAWRQRSVNNGSTSWRRCIPNLTQERPFLATFLHSIFKLLDLGIQEGRGGGGGWNLLSCCFCLQSKAESAAQTVSPESTPLEKAQSFISFSEFPADESSTGLDFSWQKVNVPNVPAMWFSQRAQKQQFSCLTLAMPLPGACLFSSPFQFPGSVPVPSPD